MTGWSLILTILTTIFLVALFIASLNYETQAQYSKFILVSVLLFLMVLMCMLWAPISVEADASMVKLKTPLLTKKLPVSEIAGVRPYIVTRPTMRICGSGGFMGSWGYFRNNDIGPFIAFYGNPDNTLLIAMKNGKKYVVGGTDPEALCAYINENLK